jgi:hypothetical protein
MSDLYRPVVTKIQFAVVLEQRSDLLLELLNHDVQHLHLPLRLGTRDLPEANVLPEHLLLR